MDTEDLAVLVHAAAAGSLSAASRRLGTTPAAASRRLAALERRVGARLMQRSTRSLTLTAEGEAFLPHARAALEALDSGQAALLSGRDEVGGRLRITASMNFGRRFVAPIVPRLLEEHPGLQIDLQLTDSVVDIVAEGIDVAVRIARLRDSALVAQKLAPNPRLLCASPAYLAAHGTPRTVAELADHECLVLGGAPFWTYELEDRVRQVRVAGRFTSNSLEALRQACLGGLGLSIFSAWDIADELETGLLVPVRLEALPPQELTIWAVYPSASQVPRKVRVFIAMLREALQQCAFRPPPAIAAIDAGEEQ